MDKQNSQPQPVQAPQMNQPTAPDTQAFSESPKVQYVVAQKSLEGVGGWLAFFVVVFALNAIFYLSQTFQTPTGIHTFTSPILFAGYLASTVLIAMRKKTALWAVYATLILSFVVAVINMINSNSSNLQPGAIIGGILVSLVGHGLLGLYFYVSKRVKATLTQN